MFRVLLRHEKLSYCQPPHKPDSKEDLRVHVGQGEEGEDASGQGGVPEQGQGVPGQGAFLSFGVGELATELRS